jgi:uncharacterized protein (TIGR03435 family)
LVIRDVRFVIVAAGVFALAVAAGAQASKPLAFEVASVKLSPIVRSVTVVTPRRVELTYMSLQGLISFAYGRTLEIAGPSWLRDVRVDVQAIPPAGSTHAQIPAMLQTLLAERFGLVAHVESRPSEVMVLSVAPAGMRMKEVEAVNDLGAAPGKLALTTEGLNGPQRLEITPSGATRTITERSMWEEVPGPDRQVIQLHAIRMSMDELATKLQRVLGERVVNRTGLTGLYQFTIALPRDALFLRVDGLAASRSGAPPPDPPGISPSRSVEALGLKLEKQRIPLDVLVVDKIERTPKEN